MTCVCTPRPSKTWSTDVGMFQRPLPKSAKHKHVQQSVDMSIQLPAGLQCNPVQMAEVQQQVHNAWDNLSQDDIWHLYERLHVRIHACVDVNGGTLCADVTFSAVFTVKCVPHLVSIYHIG